tara:strand:+ start:849 stop:2153 length:1305 start_codon:yes stop_codon:yes gene_type:complete
MSFTKTISGWGGYPKTQSEIIVPKNVSELKKNLNKPLIPRGMGRSYGDSANFSTILQTNYLDHLIEFDKNNGLLTCESGTTIQNILNLIVPNGWFIPVSPGTSFVTLGGAIASDVHGKNHHLLGTFGDHVQSIKMMLGNGEIVDTSLRNLPELFHATCGGMGLTGIILSATIKLLPIKSSKIIQTELKSNSLEETCSIFDENDSSPYSVAWLDSLASGQSQGKSIVILGEHEKDGNLNFKINKKINIPKNIPSFLINKYSISVFNKLFYAKTKNNNKKKVDIFDYFYPLDKINNWNRLYGQKGFIQYQFVIPNENVVKNLRLILDKISEFGLSSFLTVLKKFGKKNNNLLSFPMSGYTLALDFKISGDLFKNIIEIDKIVSSMGGRIYLTKDSLMSEEIFKSSYTRWEEFENVRNKYGAVGKFCSDQSKRIGLK